MNEKIFIINFFDKNEMKWYEKEELKKEHGVSNSKYRQEYKYEHTKWYHETGMPPIEAPISDDFTNEYVQLPPLLEFQEYEEYVPIKNNEDIEKYEYEERHEESTKHYAVKGPTFFLHELGIQPPKPTFGNGLKLENHFEEPLELTPLVQLEKYKEFEEYEEFQDISPYLEVED
ncbi:hypothetical protein [Oceanirhabdus sp. W0125-5]|uniref:hypothetical protein n=1 Tax=Oceanirhabdus sp. W0125-5 TaxID=2999116 RepID=UPI0022F329BF|nr:hypothetical protein [Oceanirhabdus sp. W0125-5]WBW95027.1 hypothetical protein OW730_15170 [Oceanirhabdus sp. W0125-5]